MMNSFKCDCGAVIFFDNTECLACGRKLGFVLERRALIALEPAERGAQHAGRLFVSSSETKARYRACDNSSEHQVCNWVLPAQDPHSLCLACRLNQLVPDLSLPENLQKWAGIEAAKRRLVLNLLDLGLDVVPKSEAPDSGLAFDLKADTPLEPVLTGHEHGLITINISEADPVFRERARLGLNERYRTVLGHLRHEVGHYYWDRLIRDDDARLPGFRELFGDERANYADALERHYARQTPVDWAGRFVSEYAASHPWEDWAESFAHYLHVVDLLDTATACGLRWPVPKPMGSPFEALVANFSSLTVLLNSLNRSIGQNDAYPFSIGAAVERKLSIIHSVVPRHAT
jgi:hypothetical protein